MKGGLGGVWIGWGLAVAAIAVGWASYGWPGVVLAITVIVFWLLLQFSRAMRVLRIAASNPVGHVPSAVMLNAKLKRDMKLPEVLVLTRSLGQRVAGDAESPSEIWAWTDPGGVTVQLTFMHGHLAQWDLQRADS
jgi:hypothetical protein